MSSPVRLLLLSLSFFFLTLTFLSPLTPHFVGTSLSMIAISLFLSSAFRPSFVTLFSHPDLIPEIRLSLLVQFLFFLFHLLSCLALCVSPGEIEYVLRFD
jgi:hypothetical protein